MKEKQKNYNLSTPAFCSYRHYHWLGLMLLLLQLGSNFLFRKHQGVPALGLQASFENSLVNKIMDLIFTYLDLSATKSVLSRWWSLIRQVTKWNTKNSAVFKIVHIFMNTMLAAVFTREISCFFISFSGLSSSGSICLFSSSVCLASSPLVSPASTLVAHNT